jgi:hypothetical protein
MENFSTMQPATDTKVSANLGQSITLGSLLNGRLETQFSHYISAILRAIRDTDTPAQRVRKIDLTMEIEPQNGRNYALATVALGCNCCDDFKSMVVGLFLNGSGTTATAIEQPIDGDSDNNIGRAPDTTHAIALSSLVAGAVDEAFQCELQEVVANIRNPNKVQSTKRKLKIAFRFTPSEQRNYSGLKVTVSSSCTGHNEPLISSLIISAHEGQITAHEQYIEQGNLFGN